MNSRRHRNLKNSDVTVYQHSYEGLSYALARPGGFEFPGGSSWICLRASCMPVRITFTDALNRSTV